MVANKHRSSAETVEHATQNGTNTHLLKDLRPPLPNRETFRARRWKPRPRPQTAIISQAAARKLSQRNTTPGSKP